MVLFLVPPAMVSPAGAYVKTSGLKDHLDLAFGLNASVINRNYGPTGTTGQSVLDAMYYYSPLVPVYNEDGSYYGNTSISQNYNPVRMAKEDRYETIEKRLLGHCSCNIPHPRGPRLDHQPRLREWPECIQQLQFYAFLRFRHP